MYRGTVRQRSPRYRDLCFPRIVPTLVRSMGVSDPFLAITNPEIDDVPALDTYTNFPSGVIAFQQLAVPRVGNRTKLFTLAVTLCWISDPQVRLHHLRYIRRGNQHR